MSVDASQWSARKRLKHSLLKRAFDTNRGNEVILLIQWRTAMERHKNAEWAAIARDFEEENAGQPRALRALNLISKSMGLSVVYKDTIAPAQEGDEAKQADVYIKPGFLERFLEGIDDTPSRPVIVDHVLKNDPADRISLYTSRLSDILNDFSKDNIIVRSIALQERHNNAIETFKTMPVKSNDTAYRVPVDDIASALKKPDYDDAEDAMDVMEYTSNLAAKYFGEDPDTDPQQKDEIDALAARHAGPKCGWQ